MKTLLEMKADGLEAQTRCLVCGSARLHFIRNPRFFAGNPTPANYLPRNDVMASAHFECGSEFAVDTTKSIVATALCPSTSDTAAGDLNIEVDLAFDDAAKTGEAPATAPALAVGNTNTGSKASSTSRFLFSAIMPPPHLTRRCRQCGCTDDRACVTNGIACHWVEADLCSACVDDVRAAA